MSIFAHPQDITRPFALGAWLGGWPTTSNIQQFQQDSHHHLDVGSIFLNWSAPLTVAQSSLQALDANNSIADITWEPLGANTRQIANGQFDSYIKNFADQVRSYGKIIHIRLMHEMNGNWYSWGIGDSSVNTNQSYIQSWQHIVNIFRQEGATQAKFIWCINHYSVGANASTTAAYPGDNYVDYMSIDGYNWGTTRPWGGWQSFDQIFGPAYQDLTKISHKPIIISEWASTEVGGSKAAWINDSFQRLGSGSYNQIVETDWFNESKETSWAIESSQSAQNAYAAAIHNISVNGHNNVSPVAQNSCKVNYSQQQWASSFTASIVIHNTGTQTINGWTLTFNFPGSQHLLNGWNGVFSQSGSQVTIKNNSSNANLPPNTWVNPGFNASWQGSNPSPTAFNLNGITCQ